MTRPVGYVPTPFGILLDAHRRIHRLSLRRLAQDTGMSHVEVSDVLRGKVAHAPRAVWPMLIAGMPTLTLPTLEFAALTSKVEVREPWLPEDASLASDDATGFTSAPERYTAQGRETIDCIRDELGDEGFAAFCRGNAMKYVARAGITCPVPREITLGRRRAFGSVDRAERDRRRRWYRMWRGLTVQGVPFGERVERMRAAGCTLTPRQLRVGWSCYQRTHLSDGRD